MKVIEQNLSSPQPVEETNKITHKNKPGFKSEEYYKAPFLQSYSEDQIHEAGKVPEKLPSPSTPQERLPSPTTPQDRMPSPTSLQRQDALDEQNKSPQKQERKENPKSDISQPKQEINNPREDAARDKQSTKNTKNSNRRSGDEGIIFTQQAAQHAHHMQQQHQQQHQDNARKQDYRKSRELREKSVPAEDYRKSRELKEKSVLAEDKDDLIETYQPEKYDLGHDAMEAHG